MLTAAFFTEFNRYGAWATEYGWVELLKHEAHKRTIESQSKTKLQVLNLGIGSDTSTGILKRMTNEINARHSTGWPFMFIFSFGTNDERTREGNIETSLEQFEENTRAIIQAARAYTDKILFVGAPPISQPVVTFKTSEYSDDRLATYEECLVAILATENIPFVPIRPAFEQTGLASLYAADQIHPNDAGHGLIAETVLPQLDKILGSSVAP